MKVLIKIVEFEWNKGNISKNKKHKIDDRECEEVFFDKNKIVYKDKLHSETEDRFILLGKTKNNRLLYLVFTCRGKKIRVISARDINKKEVHIYEKKT